MRIGIDFGTTHTVVALVDRGNYPVVSFESGEVFPSLIAGNAEGELRFGPAALAVQHAPGWRVLRSFKRLLNEGRQNTLVELAGRIYRLADLCAEFLAQLRHDLVHASNAGIRDDEPLEAAVSVPANASSAQRFLTLDAYRRAGFKVTALINEPSAAGFEYAHRHRNTLTARRERVLVYDLGGGTFDASLLRMSGRDNAVERSEGIQRLGGDDFDEAILELVLTRLGGAVRAAVERDPLRRALLLEECRRQKEALHPNTRRLVVDLGILDLAPLALPIDEVYRVCAPLVERSLKAIAPVLEATGGDGGLAELAGIYIVGGAGMFPLIPRLLKERFGDRRVKRSPHPFAATAIGLAISLDQAAGYTLSERLTRTFGVFREADEGEDVVFDPIFHKDTPLPGPGEPPLAVVRRYRARHNIGHYRFVECGRLERGRPDGDVTPWDEVLFPFAGELRARGDGELPAHPVVRQATDGPEVEELYVCHPTGAVEVTVRDLSDGFARSYQLGRIG